MVGHTGCRQVRLATSNLFKYNDMTDLQSDITNHEAMNTLAFATIVNGGRVAPQFLAAISRDTDLVLSCKCSSDMHQWAHDMAMGSCVWYALCPRYNALQQLGLYYQECPQTLLTALPVIVTNASLGNTGSALCNDQGTFDKDWNMDRNPLSLASSFGIHKEGPAIETALRIVLRVLPMHDPNTTLQHCLTLLNQDPKWMSSGGTPGETGTLIVRLIRDLSVQFDIMDRDELDRLTELMNEYVDLTMEACQPKAVGECDRYITNEFCMRQARLYINFYQLMAEMHKLQKRGLHRRRYAVGAMSVLFDGWKYGSYVGIVRYAGL